jgi:isoleucyl-tRNA synthetase
MKLLGRSLLPVMLSLLPTLALVPSSRVAFRAGHGRRPALRGLRSAALRSTAAESTDYSKTVLLPSTGFPQRADGATREVRRQTLDPTPTSATQLTPLPLSQVEIQSWWEKRQTYERLWATAQANEAAKFTLHDGPPYANGDLHMGHALNKVLKDMVNRYQMLSGKAVRFVPGWDCHGLPIELKVLQKMKSKERQGLTPVALRAKAGDFAKATVESQKAAFKRYGVWADWEAPYLTLQPEYEAAQIGVFAEMALAGHVYRGLKPVYWSPSSRTALAEAELEYPPEHTSRAVYAAFDVVAASPKLAQVAGGEPCRVAVWTTTAWTLPANLLVAVNADLVYAVVDAGRHGRLVVAKALVGELTGKLAGEEAGFAIEVVGELTGAELADGTTYARPFPGTAVGGAESKVVVGGDYITDEGGTGLVHTAPGHGADDYATGLKYGLEPFAPVDDGGRFTAQAGAELEKLNVLKEGTEACVEALGASGALLLDEAYAHKYPYDWRTKKPVITRATSQWFASCDSFQDEALAAIETVEWLPAAGKNRITAFVKGRNDWCISRQRTWGVPIPVFYERATGEPLLTAETLKHVQGIVAEHGTDAWFAWETADLLPPALKARADEFEKGRDTMDVWFDSGTSWAGVVGARGDLLGALPADMYLEGSDQHRGWFQSSLLTSVAANPANPVAPYKSVLTHGFVLDEKVRFFFERKEDEEKERPDDNTHRVFASDEFNHTIFHLTRSCNRC